MIKYIYIFVVWVQFLLLFLFSFLTFDDIIISDFFFFIFVIIESYLFTICIHENMINFFNYNVLFVSAVLVLLGNHLTILNSGDLILGFH